MTHVPWEKFKTKHYFWTITIVKRTFIIFVFCRVQWIIDFIT